MNGRWTAPTKVPGEVIWQDLPLGSEEYASTSALQKRLEELDAQFIMAATPVPADFAIGAMLLLVIHRFGPGQKFGALCFIAPAKFLEAHPPKKRRRKKP